VTKEELMSTQSSTRGRSAAAGGRFARAAAQSGRSGRMGGQSARSGRQSARSGRTQGSAGRFGRTLAMPGTSRRSTASTGRSLPMMHRRAPKKSGLSNALSALSSALPTGGAASAKRGGTKPAGIALVAAAAGMAFKNRDKLAGMMGRGKERQTGSHMDPQVPGQPQPTPPAAI
jgi:hypothetical protein